MRSEPDVDVVIVGAGIAGLSAALHLADAGRTVALLESAGKPGGRVQTDLVDGWRLDRGFQVHDTAYPTMASLLDSEALRLKEFTPGAVIHKSGHMHKLADPRRRPGQLLSTALAPIGSLKDKAAIGLLAAKLVATKVPKLLQLQETTTYEMLRSAGIGDTSIDTFWRPFLSGVFLENELRTSSRFFSLVLRSQARGDQCIPARGMGAIPEQLAARLPKGVLRLETPVIAVHPDSVETEGERLSARAVVVATDPLTAHTLLPDLGPAPRMNACTTAYFSAPDHDPEAVIHLEGGGPTRGPIANATVIPSDQPGRLLAVTGLGEGISEHDFRTQLIDWHGGKAAEWELISMVNLKDATVDMAVPQGIFRQQVALGDGLYVCGDHRDSASTQGAAVSGRRTARMVLAALEA